MGLADCLPIVLFLNWNRAGKKWTVCSTLRIFNRAILKTLFSPHHAFAEVCFLIKKLEFALWLRHRCNGLFYNLFLVVIPIGSLAVSRKKFLAENAPR
jgi:hypothetical protein